MTYLRGLSIFDKLIHFQTQFAPQKSILRQNTVYGRSVHCSKGPLTSNSLFCGKAISIFHNHSQDEKKCTFTSSSSVRKSSSTFDAVQLGNNVEHLQRMNPQKIYLRMIKRCFLACRFLRQIHTVGVIYFFHPFFSGPRFLQ